jgi:hypothetical protein
LEEKLKKQRSQYKAHANTVVKDKQSKLDSYSTSSGSDSAGSVLETYLCEANSCELETNVLDNRFPTWILDSGATHHVTGDPKLLHQINPYTRSGPILAAGGESHTVAGKGTVHLKMSDGEIKFKNVLYVPGTRRNLLSKDSHDRGITFWTY